MTDTGLTAVSLFAGIGGFDKALQDNGVKVVANCEIDKHAQKILTRHFPDTQLFSDVSTLKGEELVNAGFIPERGIVVGGFPCQDVSVAGRRAGLTRADGTHTRSGLFWEVVRLLEETKAQYFVLENVPGLLTSNNGLDFATILCALQNVGYVRVAWRILDAQFTGVPQRRRRVFIVGSLGNDGASPSEILSIVEGRRRYLEASEQKGQKTSRKVGASPDEGGIIGTITTAFDSKNYSNHQEVLEGSILPLNDKGEWWNGSQIAGSLTTKSNDQRMPDKGRFQAVITPEPRIGNFELITFPDEAISISLSATRAHDTITY